MRHIELIELIYKNREIIDRAYRGDKIFSLNRSIEDLTLFIKVGDEYRLNRNYINFVNSILQRVDYDIIFSNYEEEYKELIKNRNRFLKTKKDIYKKSILKFIEDLYYKFSNRDREITLLLLKLENDRSLDIDILIEKSYDILEKINEFIDANQKIRRAFRVELRGIDFEIDRLLEAISINIFEFIDNIDGYISRLNSFVLQTKRKREVNRKIIQLSNLILEEKSNSLDEYLFLHSSELYHSLLRSQKNRVFVYPDERNINKISKEIKIVLENINIKRPKRDKPIKKQKQEILNLIDIDKIIEDLRRDGSRDIFISILKHSQLDRFQEERLIEEAFKIFLQLTREKNIKFIREFNQYGVRIARWD